MNSFDPRTFLWSSCVIVATGRMPASNDDPYQPDLVKYSQQLKNELEGLRIASSDCVNKLLGQIMDLKTQASVAGAVKELETSVKGLIDKVAQKSSEDLHRLKQDVLKSQADHSKNYTESLHRLQGEIARLGKLLAKSQQHTSRKTVMHEQGSQAEEPVEPKKKSQDAKAGTEEYNCQLCGITFDTVQARLIYELSESHYTKVKDAWKAELPSEGVHDSETPPEAGNIGGYKCPLTQASFNSRESLYRHMLSKPHFEEVLKLLKAEVGEEQFETVLKDNMLEISSQPTVVEALESALGRRLPASNPSPPLPQAFRSTGAGQILLGRDPELQPVKRHRSNALDAPYGSDDGNPPPLSINPNLDTLHQHLQLSGYPLSQTPQSPATQWGHNIGLPRNETPMSQSNDLSQLSAIAALLQDPPPPRAPPQAQSVQQMFLNFAQQQLRSTQDRNETTRVRQELRNLFHQL